MDIGLFGGTFNPIHNGHLGIIEHVQKTFDLEKIFFIPSATPPHKPEKNLAPAQYRFQMVKDSLKGYRHLLPSDKELLRQGPSYTIDTINEFKAEYGPDTDFYLLMGSDAFLDITTWKRNDQIFDSVKIIIMLRGYWENYTAIISFIDENISKGYIFDKHSNTFSHKTKHQLFICQVPKIDISSSLVRKRIKNNESINQLVPQIVEDIIKTKELYQ